MQFPKTIRLQGVFTCPGEKSSLSNEYQQKGMLRSQEMNKSKKTQNKPKLGLKQRQKVD